MLQQNTIEEGDGDSVPHDKNGSHTKRLSRTDPDATLATSSRNQKMIPSYKQHTSVDDQNGIVVDVIVTTGERNEGEMVQDQIQRIEANTGKKIETMTADAGYAYAKVYGYLEENNIDAIIPPKKPWRSNKVISLDRFKYDGKHQTVRCPARKFLKRSTKTKHGWYYRSSVHDCRNCPLRKRCLSPKIDRRTVVISDHYEALLRARRRRPHWDSRIYQIYNRHRWRAEGAHSDAKLQHGLHRAIRWGLDNMAIQAYLTAAVMNLKRMAAFCLYFWRLVGLKYRLNVRPWLPAGRKSLFYS